MRLNRLERALPLQLPLLAVAEQSVRTEVDVDLFAVGGRRGRSRVVQLMHALELGDRRRAAPEDLAARPLQANRFQSFGFSIETRDVDVLVPNARRGVTARQRRLPHNLAAHAERDRQPQSVAADALSARSTELRPARFIRRG